MGIRYEDVQRRIAYQNIKRANSKEQEEIGYHEFGDYEIITIHNKPVKSFWWDTPAQESFRTYRWYGNCQFEILQEYSFLKDALDGHYKWCQKEFAV